MSEETIYHVKTVRINKKYSPDNNEYVHLIGINNERLRNLKKHDFSELRRPILTKTTKDNKKWLNHQRDYRLVQSKITIIRGKN